jgi:hypothetical protein
MKMELWKSFSGVIHVNRLYTEDTLLGTIEVTEPKKVVTKEHKLFGEWQNPATTIHLPEPVIPVGAKNVRLLYDIEE